LLFEGIGWKYQEACQNGRSTSATGQSTGIYAQNGSQTKTFPVRADNVCAAPETPEMLSGSI